MEPCTALLPHTVLRPEQVTWPRRHDCGAWEGWDGEKQFSHREGRENWRPRDNPHYTVYSVLPVLPYRADALSTVDCDTKGVMHTTVPTFMKSCVSISVLPSKTIDASLYIKRKFHYRDA